MLFRLHDDTTDGQRASAIDVLRQACAASRAFKWQVEESLDQRKGFVVIEDMTFTSTADFADFYRSPAHRRATAELSQVADWLAGDYLSS